MVAACSARSPTVSCRSRSRSSTRSWGSSAPPSGAGEWWMTSWARPPSRSSGMTARRAAFAARAAPWSRRTRCRHRSRPVAAGRGENGAVVEVADVQVYDDGRVPVGERRGGLPVGGGAPAVDVHVPRVSSQRAGCVAQVRASGGEARARRDLEGRGPQGTPSTPSRSTHVDDGSEDVYDLESELRLPRVREQRRCRPVGAIARPGRARERLSYDAFGSGAPSRRA